MSKVVLKCNNLYKKIGDRVLVDDVSFSLNEGEIMGQMGLVRLVLLRLFLVFIR